VNGKLLIRLRVFGCFLLFSLFAFLVACGEEPEAGPTAVGENGIPIAAEFQVFYQEYGGQDVLGEPVTEMFTTAPGERPLQYFQNMRLEYDLASSKVQVSPLGEWELGGLNEQVTAPVPEDGANRTFPDSEFTVQDEFLRFYEDKAGDVLLGLPISPQLNVDGLRVQYFENGRLEWHPEAPANQRVQLGDLGQTHFDNEMVFTYQEMRPARPVSSAGVTDIDVAAYVKAPILYAGEDQVLYVTTRTPGGDPVSNVIVEIVIAYDDKTETVRSTPTDDLGQAKLPLNYNIPPGKDVVLQLTALNSNGRSLGNTVLTYETWW
jgi:hypothetical protein